jgi:hypothetical protein
MMKLDLIMPWIRRRSKTTRQGYLRSINRSANDKNKAKLEDNITAFDNVLNRPSTTNDKNGEETVLLPKAEDVNIKDGTKGDVSIEVDALFEDNCLTSITMQAEKVQGKLYSGNNNGNSVDNKDIVYGPFARYHYFCGLNNYKVDVDVDDVGTEMKSIDVDVDDGEMKSKAPNGIRDLTDMTNNDGEDDDDSIPDDIDLFIANRKDEDILLVYPFEVDKKKIEAAASDRNELSYKDTTPNDHETIHSSTNTRSPTIAIHVETYNLLEDGQWLNNSLVRFLDAVDFT